MSGYDRQSVADIVANEVIKAAPINAELNALRDAFIVATGHKHDGTATEGAYVPIIADTDALNKVVIDTANNRVQFFVEVSSAAVEQLRLQDGVVVPVTDNDIDLGTTTLEFKDLYLDGTAKVDTLTVDENATIAGTLGVTGAVTMTGNLTVNGNTTLGDAATDTVTITADVASNILPSADDTYDLGAVGSEWKDLYIDGTANIDSLVADTADINGGTIDGTTIGGNSAAAGSFTTVAASSNATVGGTLNVTGAATFTNNVTINGNTILGDSNTDTVTVTADVASSLIPSADSTYPLGDSSNYWSAAFIDAITTTGNISTGGNLTVTGTTTFTGTVTANGNTVLGSDASDTVTITADVASNIIPSADSTYTLGDTSNYWSHGYIDAITTTGNVTVGGSLTVTSIIDMTNDKITNLATPTNTGDAATKGYVDTADALKLSLTGGTMSGAIAMGTNKITGLGTPTDAADAATKGYVDTTVSNLVDSAPGTLDTLNELAAALGDDPNFATTVTNSIATKVAKAGDTMTGDLVMGTNKVTSTATPATDDTLTRKGYVDTQDALKLSLTGGTMSGAIAMGTNKITGLGTPTDGNDATNKTYVDGILGSATSAAASASAAAASASAAASSYDSFDDRYLGAKSVEPSLDNDGDPLLTGALYFNTVTNKMRVYDGSVWNDAGSAVNGTAERFVYTATSGQTTFSANYDVGFVDVYLNGVKLLAGTDFTASTGTNIVLAVGAALNDVIDIVGYGAFLVANTYTQATADGKFLQITNNLSDLNSAATALQNLGLTATAAEVNLIDGSVAGTIVNSKAVVYGAAGEVNATTLQIAGSSITATAAELNVLDGVTASTAELNILDGVTADASELNVLDGITASTAELNYNDITTLGTSQASKVVTADANGDVNLSEELKAKSYNETYAALSGTTPTVDCETGNMFALSTSGNTTFTFSNPPASGTAYGFTLKLTAGGTHTITWPASVDWAGGTAPDAPASGEVNVYAFITHDGGTNWYGFLAGAAMA